MRENILNIEDLSIWYRTYRGYSKVVDHINQEKERKQVWLVSLAVARQQQ